MLEFGRLGLLICGVGYDDLGTLGSWDEVALEDVVVGHVGWAG
jgi:hypothetical protein